MSLSDGMLCVADHRPDGSLEMLRQCAPPPGVELRANRKSISHRCHPILVVFLWEMTKETIDLPLGCLSDGMLCVADHRPDGSLDAAPVRSLPNLLKNAECLEDAAKRGRWGGRFTAT